MSCYTHNHSYNNLHREIMDDYNSHTIIYRAVFIKATTATPPFRHLSPNCNISKGGICCGSQPQRRNLQRLTVCLSFSRRQRLMLFFINHRQHLCHRSVKLSRYLLTYVYRLIKPSCERTVFCDIYVMLLRNCNYPQWPVRLYPLPRQQALCRLSCGHI